MWFSSGSAGWLAGAVVAAVGVEGEVAEDLAGGGVDDASGLDDSSTGNGSATRMGAGAARRHAVRGGSGRSNRG